MWQLLFLAFAKNEFILILKWGEASTSRATNPNPNPHPKLLEIVLQFQLISMLINNNNSGADATRTRETTTTTSPTTTATIMKATLIPRYFSRVWHVSLDFPVLDSNIRICYNPLSTLPCLCLILRGGPIGRRQGTRHAADVFVINWALKQGSSIVTHPNPLTNGQSSANGQLNFLSLSLSLTQFSLAKHAIVCFDVK